MRRRRTKRTLRPRTPSRVKKKKARGGRGGGGGGGQRAELAGLGLAALGVFLASVLYAGWSGGVVGGGIVDGVRALVGGAAYAVPAVALVVGGLVLARSELVDVRPFRTGLALLALGLELVLGGAHGGLAGRGLEKVFGTLLGGTGATILGTTLLLAGTLLLTGASGACSSTRSGGGSAVSPTTSG